MTFYIYVPETGAWYVSEEHFNPPPGYAITATEPPTTTTLLMGGLPKPAPPTKAPPPPTDQGCLSETFNEQVINNNCPPPPPPVTVLPFQWPLLPPAGPQGQWVCVTPPTPREDDEGIKSQIKALQEDMTLVKAQIMTAMSQKNLGENGVGAGSGDCRTVAQIVMDLYDALIRVKMPGLQEGTGSNKEELGQSQSEANEGEGRMKVIPEQTGPEPEASGPLEDEKIEEVDVNDGECDLCARENKLLEAEMNLRQSLSDLCTMKDELEKRHKTLDSLEETLTKQRDQLRQDGDVWATVQNDWLNSYVKKVARLHKMVMGAVEVSSLLKEKETALAQRVANLDEKEVGLAQKEFELSLTEENLAKWEASLKSKEMASEKDLLQKSRDIEQQLWTQQSEASLLVGAQSSEVKSLCDLLKELKSDQGQCRAFQSPRVKIISGTVAPQNKPEKVCIVPITSISCPQSNNGGGAGDGGEGKGSLT